MFPVVLIILFTLLFLLLKRLNRDYFILNISKRVKTNDGSKLETKIPVIHGKTIFGSNFDLLKITPETIFQFFRQNHLKSKGKSYLLYFFTKPYYNVTNAEDVEEIFQSQNLISKSIIYDVIKPFLGDGLLISTDKMWQFRRKLLTPAFHFNILQSFIEVFREEAHKFIKTINEQLNQTISLDEVIPQFTLNSICETALGVKLDNIPGSELYRSAIRELEPILIKRLCNPFMYIEIYFKLFGEYKEQQRLLDIVHKFSSKIIEKKRKEFRNKLEINETEKIDDFGQKKRYAMLDTLLDAERQGLIDHQGICDEVNTFMFEGFDTTSMCLMFVIMNLALYQDIQEKCFEEIDNLSPFNTLTVFDFNKLEYLECVIKETLRLYPSVPFVSRICNSETNINGLILPKNSEINVHIFDIMRDERHFPEPLQFKPERFKADNTTNRHPFAYVPFSAGPRNCIGQKFAMLEVKVLLVAILKNFQILPITRLEDVIFENGLVLRTKNKLKVQFLLRH